MSGISGAYINSIVTLGSPSVIEQDGHQTGKQLRQFIAMEKFPSEMYAAISTSAPNIPSELANILVEKHLKEDIIGTKFIPQTIQKELYSLTSSTEQGQALYGTRYPSFKVFIAISENNAHTAHLIHFPHLNQFKPRDYEILTSGMPAGDVCGALRVLLDSIRREFAAEVGRKMKR